MVSQCLHTLDLYPFVECTLYHTDIINHSHQYDSIQIWESSQINYHPKIPGLFCAPGPSPSCKSHSSSPVGSALGTHTGIQFLERGRGCGQPAAPPARPNKWCLFTQTPRWRTSPQGARASHLCLGQLGPLRDARLQDQGPWSRASPKRRLPGALMLA